MFNLADGCGFVSNFIQKEKLSTIVNTMKKFDPSPVPEGDLFGVDYKHPNYEWFMDEFFVLLQDYTNRPDLKLIFGMYADVCESFKIHRDIKDLPGPQPPCKHFASFLVPVSVDNEIEKCKQNCTLVFENALQLEPDFDQPWHYKVKQTRDMPYYKLVRDITWEPCGLIWWNSLLPHAGAHLPSLGFTSKQMIVAHTYV